MESGTPEKKEEKKPKPSITITIYGGKKEEVHESVSQHLAPDEESSVYSTWINIRAFQRLGFLFVGGVESAMGLFEVVCMFVLVVLIFALFAFWQVIIFGIVIVVLTILSGGAAFKYVRGTFIESDITKIDFINLETFVGAEVSKGRFVEVKADSTEHFEETTRKSSSLTRIFKTGIHWSMVIATVFLIYELVHWWLIQSWATDFWTLVFFGVAFLIGVIAMDVGVLMRKRLASRLAKPMQS